MLHFTKDKAEVALEMFNFLSELSEICLFGPRLKFEDLLGC